MSRTGRAHDPVPDDQWEYRDVPGVTRLDLMWRPGIDQTLMSATSQWVQSRVLPGPAGERLACLVRAALSHGARFAPRAVTLLIRWQDPSRVRVDLRWVGASHTATAAHPGPDLATSTAVFDAFADAWGVGPRRNGWVHWMVVDTG